MTLKEDINEVERWGEDLGLTALVVDDLNLSYTQTVSKKIDSLTPHEISEELDKVSSYHVFISSQKGDIESKLGLAKVVYNRMLHTATEKLCKPNTFKTYEERKTLALNMDGKLSKLCHRIAVLQAKFDKIKDIPRVIENRLIVLRRICEKSINESKFKED
jgi:hypothetical protein